MPDEEYIPREDSVRAVVEMAHRAISDSPHQHVDARKILRATGLDRIEAHYAFRVAAERGYLVVSGWHGNMGVPYDVEIGPVPLS